MKTYIKILSMLPIISLASCSGYNTLSNDEALNRAKEILEKQATGTVSYTAFTYSGKYIASFNGGDDIMETSSRKLIRDYQNPYLYFSLVNEEDNQTFTTRLWIYRTDGNVIYAYYNSLESVKKYTAYPLSNENVFASLIDQSADLTDIKYVEKLTYSQESLQRILDFYTKPEPREIYQGYSFVARSKGEGSLDIESNFAYVDNEDTIAVSEELTMIDYLFSSQEIVNTVTQLDEEDEYETITLKQSEVITYKAKLTYPNLNEFTFVNYE